MRTIAICFAVEPNIIAAAPTRPITNKSAPIVNAQLRERCHVLRLERIKTYALEPVIAHAAPQFHMLAKS